MEDTYIPTIEVAGHTALAATPIPVGTPEARLPMKFGPGYKACAVAHLDATAFIVKTDEAHCWSLDQSVVTWEWNIISQETGRHGVNVFVEIHWQSTKEDVSPIPPSQIWRARLDILVKRPWVKTAQQYLVYVIGMITGSGTWASFIIVKRRGMDISITGDKATIVAGNVEAGAAVGPAASVKARKIAGRDIRTDEQPDAQDTK